MRGRKYTYDKLGQPIYVVDEYGASYFIAPDGSWTPDYDVPIFVRPEMWRARPDEDHE